MNNVIKRNWFYNNPREEVWEYLTNAELISKWLMPNNFKLEVGYEFEFWTNPIPELSLDGNFYCKVIEIIPQKKLVYSYGYLCITKKDKLFLLEHGRHREGDV